MGRQDDDKRCPVCLNDCSSEYQEDDMYSVDCPKCGKFAINGTADTIFRGSTSELKQKGSRERANLSSWLRESRKQQILYENFFSQEPPSEVGLAYKASHKPNIEEKADKLLSALKEKTNYAGEFLDWLNDQLEYEARAWALNDGELAFLAYWLNKEGLISGGVLYDEDARQPSVWHLFNDISITPKGWQRLADITTRTGSENTVFVASMFDKEQQVTRLYRQVFQGCNRNYWL